MLGYRGILIDEDEDLKEQLTVVLKSERRLFAFKSYGAKILIPCIFSNYIRIDRREPEKRITPIDVPLWDYQNYIKCKMMKKIREKGRVYLWLGTRCGKTRISVNIALGMGIRTLVISPSQKIAKQWISEFLKFTEISNEINKVSILRLL